jgi:hypothetical protein
MTGDWTQWRATSYEEVRNAREPFKTRAPPNSNERISDARHIKENGGGLTNNPPPLYSQIT